MPFASDQSITSQRKGSGCGIVKLRSLFISGYQNMAIEQKRCHWPGSLDAHAARSRENARGGIIKFRGCSGARVGGRR